LGPLTSVQLQSARTGIIRILHTRARHTVTTARNGSRTESSLARVHGSTDSMAGRASTVVGFTDDRSTDLAEASSDTGQVPLREGFKAATCVAAQHSALEEASAALEDSTAAGGGNVR
jgi:hypothetical protein